MANAEKDGRKETFSKVRKRLKYAVYFDQVNACRFVVEAYGQQGAVDKAHSIWRRDFGDNWPSTVEAAGADEEAIR